MLYKMKLQLFQQDSKIMILNNQKLIGKCNILIFHKKNLLNFNLRQIYYKLNPFQIYVKQNKEFNKKK